VIEVVLLVTTLPPASCTCTVTAGVIEAPPAVFDGCVPNASLAAAPTVILNELLVAPVNPVLLAVKVYPVPALSMDRLLNVATPLTAAAVVVPLSVPLLGFVPIATVTLAVLLVRLPFESRIRTVTEGAIGCPPAAFVGCCATANCVAVRAVMLSALLVLRSVSIGRAILLLPWRRLPSLFLEAVLWRDWC
jgi:hypothetical protein